jgi:lysophospholipase L1-like esterase
MGDPPPNEHRRRPGVLRKLLLIVAASLVLFVVALEVLSRVADRVVAPRIASGEYKPDRPDKTPPGDLWERTAFATLDPGAKRVGEARNVPHPYLGYALKPGFRTPPDAPQQCSHNDLGLRGRETTWAKPPGVFRIVTTGGSSVYGQSESRDEAVWSHRLEEILAETRPDLRIEVINGGCNGWTSFEMLINLEIRMLDFEPDLVVVYEAINDMRAALYTAARPEPARDNTHWRSTWPVDRPSALEDALESSRAYLIWRRWMTSYWKKRVDLGYYAMAAYDPDRVDLYCQWPDGRVPERGFENYRRNLESLIAVAERRGARVMLATQALMRWYMVPPMECAEVQVESFDRIQRIQREVAASRGAVLAETAREIEAEEARAWKAEEARILAEGGEATPELRQRLLFKNDVHPTDAGSEAIARAVAKAVLESGILPRRE